LAHAFSKPLMSVRAAAEELRMTAADPNSQRMGEIIFRQVEYMERMVGALLDSSLLERGHLQIAHSSVELLPVIELAVEECRPALELESSPWDSNLSRLQAARLRYQRRGNSQARSQHNAPGWDVPLCSVSFRCGVSGIAQPTLIGGFKPPSRIVGGHVFLREVTIPDPPMYGRSMNACQMHDVTPP
jgi:signal transduction histidine kinase